MANGASIPQLLRVHFANIGHPDARLSPLSLNFFRETDVGGLEPVDSVIWAENGVGKSSIRTLLFSLLHPSIHDVMKASGGPLDNRKFELFFGPKDVSFVLTEWVLPDSNQPNLAGFPEDPNRLVLGFVAHWPSGSRTSLSDLERHYFLFKPSGKTTFERLPVRGLARGCEPVNSAREFLDWFRERAKYVEGRQTTVHKDWLNLLEEAGLDPMIFTYQLRMNSGQGGILGLFKNRINSATDFVHFFLETVLSPDIASDVVEVLNEKRRHVERQPQWEAECQFVDEAIPMLRALQQAKNAFDEAENDYETDLKRAGSLIGGLQTVENELDRRGQDLSEDIDDLEKELSKINDEFLKAGMIRDWLKRKAHEFTLVASEEDLQTKQGIHSKAQEVLRLLRAATEYVDWQAKLDECVSLERDLASRQGSYGDVEKDLHQAGAQYAAILETQVGKLKETLSQTQATYEQMRKSLAEDMTRFNTSKTEMGKVREEIRGLQTLTQKREKALQRLLHGHALQEGESLPDARKRWEKVSKDATKALEQDQKTYASLEKEREHLKQTSREATVELTRIQSEMERLKTKRDHDENRRQALENDHDLRLMFGNDEVRLGEEDLLGRIRERIAQLQGETYRLNNLLTDKKETLAAIEQTDSRLYPAPPFVAQLLRTLREDLRIPAVLGTEILDTTYPDDPEKAEALLVQDPARFLGLMVHTAEALEQVRKLQDTIPKPAFPVQISLAKGTLNQAPPDAIVLNPGHRAAINRNAAEAMIDPLRREIGEKSLRLSECQQTGKRLEETHTRLKAFLADYPSGDLRELLNEIGDLATHFGNLRERYDRQEARLQELDESLNNLRANQASATSQARLAENAIARIQDFDEDHEAQHAVQASLIQEKRARLHELEDESLVLEAGLEETQRTLTERQEQIFNRKAELHQIEETLRGIKYRDAKAKKDKQLTLVKARNSYQLYLDRFLQVSEKDETLRARLEERQAVAEHCEMRFRRELGDADETAVTALLEAGNLADRTQEAVQEERQAALAVGAAEETLTRSREALRQLLPLPADFKTPRGYKSLKRLNQIEEKQTEQTALLERLETSLATQKETLQALKEQLRQIREQQQVFRLKSEEMQTHIPDFVAGPLEVLPKEVLGVTTLLREFWDQFRRHRRYHSKAKLDLMARFDLLKDLANDARFQDFPNDKREILKTRESVLSLTDDIIKEFTIFREVIRTSLRMAEESVDAIVTRLDAGVTDAFYLLNQSKQSSRLPETMEGWAGKSFLKIECKSQVGDGFSERKPLYERVIRDVLRAGKPIRGLDLIKRALDALVGEKGYKVVIMKPGYALKTQYHPVTDVKGWSDGEKITSVILLYCTMVQLRAVSSGKSVKETELRKPSSGMLFLDNPFGEANSLTFVKMQLLMARALNIQLVYTASGSHKHLMARFPRVVRLSQEAGSKTQKTFVKATDVGTELRDTVKATHVQAAHFGQRAS